MAACKRSLLTIGCVLLLSLASATNAVDLTRDNGRTDTWEFTLQPRFTEATTIDFNGGAKAEVNDDVGFGFGFAYNYTSQVALGFDLSWNSANYNATRVLESGNTEKVGGSLDSSTMSFAGTYYFTGGRLAPFVSGALGWTYLDTNIPSGPSEGVCWWDPYWGYVCGEYTPTKSAWEFAYGAGLGLRWDLTNAFFLRGSVNQMRVDVDNSTGTNNVTLGRVDIGFAF